MISSTSLWFQTQPNDACVFCEQCVTRGLNFSELITATQFLLIWFSGWFVPKLLVCLFSHKISVLCQQSTSTISKVLEHLYLFYSIKLLYTYGLPIFLFSLHFISFSPMLTIFLQSGQISEESRYGRKTLFLSQLLI